MSNVADIDAIKKEVKKNKRHRYLEREKRLYRLTFALHHAPTHNDLDTIHGNSFRGCASFSASDAGQQKSVTCRSGGLL